ncbi:hypothetical protein CVT24_002492 [Panaeolus cyanescens]|uniref:Uncharacterized protein n=1 Tax=Panaeolus cyanescens TaxID=181874 RepID=A0A409WBS6_9AGAR|nr:hypothetical protein CVT24_002492 [Panaeolus cyanescens]
MESLNLNTLANSLPNSQQNAETKLTNDFKAAALSITTLYRSSKKNAKRAYNAGYAAACQDLLEFIQQGVSASGDVGHGAGPSRIAEGSTSGMTIGQIMDWTEARVEAIKAREEEEDEDEERAQPARSAAATAAASRAASTAKSAAKKSMNESQPKETLTPLPTPSSPISPHTTIPSTHSSPSPPPSSGPSSRPTIRYTKAKGPSREGFHQPALQTTNLNNSALIGEPFSASAPITPFTEAPILQVGAGVKRRHAMMMMLDSSSPTINIGGGPSSAVSTPGAPATHFHHSGSPNLSRRRTRSARNLNLNLNQHASQLQNQNLNVIQVPNEAMDVEEEGRERKRANRR